MPFAKHKNGWQKTEEGQDGAKVYNRLILIDKQADPKGTFEKAVLDTVKIVSYNSKKTKFNQLIELVGNAHMENGSPFESIAVANHGPDQKLKWVWAKDKNVSMQKDGTAQAVGELKPLLDTLVAATKKSGCTSHIELLACRLDSINSDFVPMLEDIYQLDFRASRDDTGNENENENKTTRNWIMETDNYDFAKDYLDEKAIAEYKEQMGGAGMAIGCFFLDMVVPGLGTAIGIGAAICDN
eukprot:m.342441 g.342441  ORF g.342441 m.342441 type:complete len:241 (-) comp21386_c0_seq1:19-741(-)